MIRTFPPVCLLLAALLAACGGGSGGDQSPATSGPSTTMTAAAARACAPARPHSPGDSLGTITVAGLARDYLLHVPPAYDAAAPLPLVLGFHGFALDKEFFAGYTQFPRLADEAGFLFVSLDGLGEPRHWNSGKDPAGADDVAFVRDLLARLEADLCVDTARVYAAGFSVGGAMARLAACELPGAFAAIGVVASTYVSCRAPVPLVAFHGTADPVVPFEPLDDTAEPAALAPPVRRWASEWARVVGCGGLPLISLASSEVELSTFITCPDGDGDVVLYTILGGGHTWPGAIPIDAVGYTTAQIDATRVIWGFFAKRSGGR